MEDIHRKALTESITFLKNNLLVKDLLDHLVEEYVITIDWKQTINFAVTDSDKVSELVCVLLRRGPGAYEAFLKSICATQQEYIADYLEKKVMDVKEKLIAKTQHFVRLWLQDNLSLASDGNGVVIEIDWLLDAVNSAISSSNSEDLTECIDIMDLKKMLMVTFEQPETAVNQNPLPFIKRESQLVDQMTAISQSPGTSFDKKTLPKLMKDWCLADVCLWLEQIGMDADVRQKFSKEKIAGRALMLMTKEDMKDIEVSAAGDRIIILSERDNYLTKMAAEGMSSTSVELNSASVEVAECVVSLKPEPDNLNFGKHRESDFQSGCSASLCTYEKSLEFTSSDTQYFSAAAMKEDENETAVEEDLATYCISLKPEEEIPNLHKVVEKPGTGSKISPGDNIMSDVKCKKPVETNILKPDSMPVTAKAEKSSGLRSIKSTASSKVKLPSEVLRIFSSPQDIEFKYKKGAKLSCIETRSGGNLLQPIHRFIMLELDTSDKMKKFANEAIAFACACLNDRANGTIHFGIVPETSSGNTVHGQIMGVHLKRDCKKYAEFLYKAFEKCFVEVEIARKCVSLPVFIKVVLEDLSAKYSEFVIEIDVTPKYEYCMNRTFYIKLDGGKDEEEIIFRILDGGVCQLKQPQIHLYMQEKDRMAGERKRQEDNAVRKKCKPRDKLCEKFINLLCDGDTKFHGDQYRILVINKPNDAVDYDTMKERFEFLSGIGWKAIFDFDFEAKVCGFLQKQDYMMKIAMSDDLSPRFACNMQKTDRLKQIQDDIRNSLTPTWIFVNGYAPNNDPKLSPRNWKMEKSDGFKEAVRFFARQIPQRRALIVFLLLSEDTSVVIEAAEEFLTSFPNQWLCVAEKESIGNPWLEELQRRNCIENGNERSVFGMPWKQVQEVVADMVTPRRINCCELPTSTGTFVVLHNKEINKLLDLEILSSFECDNSSIAADEQTLRQHEVEEKEMFFRGNGVSWWNFWFKGQVCRREILRDLKKAVKESLNDEDVSKIILRHQPGAGGTTTAKHLLWELRKDYRCGIVLSINEGQTARQIINLYQYEDSSPTKPVVLLLDNPDEEKANLLVAELSEIAKDLTRKGGDQAKCVCIFLICLRRTEVGTQDPRRLVLGHQLLPKEQKWFADMHKLLLAEHKHEPDRFVNPNRLIAFNMLKENFNKDFIQRMVKSFLDAIKDPKERKLLTYISLVNSFDIDCRPLPTSAFDGIMIDNPWSSRNRRRGRLAYISRWETHLSSEFRVLVNEASKPSIGFIHALRIINPLLSKEILSCLRDTGNSKIQVSDIALQFYNCEDIFYASSKARDDLLDISKDILKRRGRLPNGKPETDFAPLIQTIVEQESTEKASLILEKGLQLTSDPFIAQHMARLFIKVQNWKEAIKYVTMATEQKPDNSYLWDTFGRIYERQLLEQYDRLVASTCAQSIEESVPIIKIALKGMEMFRKVQQTSDKEKTLSTNQAGFFGELQMAVCLLDCLTYFFQSKDELRRFILENEYMPKDCVTLLCFDDMNYAEELKKLNRHVQTAVNRLEDELLQLREETIDEFGRNHVKNQGESLIRLKENLNSYFGEDGDSIPDSLEEAEKCEFRRRRIFRLAGFNLRSIFDLRRKENGVEVLKHIRDIAKQNVLSDKSKVDDFQTLISANLALASIDWEYRSNFSEYDDMVQWTRKLYELRDTSIVSHLEPYLFFVMFNWPRENTKHQTNPKVIEDAIRNWKYAYYKKYPKQRDEGKPFRKKDTTMFFLASGSDMGSVFSQFEEAATRRNDSALDRYWRLPETMSKLQRLFGILSNDGCEVKIQLQYGQGNKSSICIPTSFPIRERRMWNKQVYFVIGFSWIGPKAYDVTLEDPRTTTDALAGKEVLGPRSFSNKEFHRAAKIVLDTEESFRQQLEDFDKKLFNIQMIKDKMIAGIEPSAEESQLLQEEARIQKDKDKLIQSRRKMMESRIPEFQ